MAVVVWNVDLEGAIRADCSRWTVDSEGTIRAYCSHWTVDLENTIPQDNYIARIDVCIRHCCGACGCGSAHSHRIPLVEARLVLVVGHEEVVVLPWKS